MSDVQAFLRTLAQGTAALTLRSRPLFTLQASLCPIQDLGRTPVGRRRVCEIRSGRVTGRVAGKLRPSGAGWLLDGDDGTQRLDARLLIELDDGTLAGMACRGRVTFLAEDLPLLADCEAAAAIDPLRYYMRLVPLFETSSRRYGWLNHVVAVAVGRITETGVTYKVHEIL